MRVGDDEIFQKLYGCKNKKSQLLISTSRISVAYIITMVKGFCIIFQYLKSVDVWSTVLRKYFIGKKKV